GHRELRADDHRHRSADDEHDEAEDQVQRPDVLVVGREEPALDEPLLVGVIVVVVDNVGMRGSHGLTSGDSVRASALGSAAYWPGSGSTSSRFSGCRPGGAVGSSPSSTSSTISGSSWRGPMPAPGGSSAVGSPAAAASAGVVPALRPA